jgi:hypothetical protein
VNLQYLGFEQRHNQRLYRFAQHIVGRPKLLIVSADLCSFAKYKVNIQDGPILCARKLEASQALELPEKCELTEEDFCAHAALRDLAEQGRAASRERLRNRLPARRPRSLHTGHWG